MDSTGDATGIDVYSTRRTHKRVEPEEDSTMAQDTETREGYVIDVGCIRKNAREDLLEKARTHTRECALMGHCVESGYGLVTEEDRLTILDAKATPKVVEVVENSETDQGITLRAEREEQDGKMATTEIEEVNQEG
jgi:hypothetical protein